MKNILSLLLLLISVPLLSQTSFTSIWNTNNVSSGSSAVNQITIPTNSTFSNYNFSVDWGDGNTDTNLTGNITHTYALPGIYTVSISGTFPAIYFNNTGDRRKITSILSWGNIPWQSMENAFYGCDNLNFDAINSPNLTQVTSLKNMFRGCTLFNGIVNNWNVSTITDISGLFANCRIFNRPLDTWNTIAITDMSETFSGAYQFNEPLDNWNTASVTTLKNTFSAALRFNQNINGWDVSQVTNMSGTFRSTSNFNQPLNNWNVSNVLDMSNMFEASDFNLPLNSWNVSNVTNMSGMFSQYSKFNQNIDNWNVASVTNMKQMFYRGTVFNQPLNNWNVSNVTDMSGMFDGFIVAMAFNQPLNNWNVSKVTNMSSMFRDCDAFNQPLNNWNVSNVTNMSQMFEHALAFNQDITTWNVNKVTAMNSMFQETQNFNQNLNNWDVSNVTNMASMFDRATAFNQPLNNWNTTKITNLSSMFSGATAFNQPLNNWNTINVTNMSNMFNQANSFNQSLASFNVTKVTNMSNMLSRSGLSQTNYDATLIGWAAQTVRNNVNLGALNVNYCDGRIARQQLLANNNWTITGDIINCSFVLCTNLVSPLNGDTNVPASANLTWAPTPGATGYRVRVRIIRAGIESIPFDGIDVGNNVGLNLETPLGADLLEPGDQVFVTIIPYNITDGPAVGCTEESFTVVPSWVNNPAAFKLTYDTRLQEAGHTTPINQLRIQTRTGLSYNYSIDWGDNQFDNNVTGEITHTYFVPGIYTISIIGTFPAPRHEESYSDSFKLLSIDQWGTQVWQSMQNGFSGCENMVYNATDIPNLSAVTSMNSMFILCRKFNGNINNWNVSNVKDMTAIFGVASIFNQPLDNWDVSNVTDMGLMFFRTDNFNQNINSWNTSKVAKMSRMFEDAKAFNQSINAWNVSSVTTMDQMFQRAKVFNQPLNNWNVSNVTNMSKMFSAAEAFNQNIDNLNVAKVTDMSSMFNEAKAFNQPLNSWNVGSVNDMSSMFSSATVFNQPLNNWNVTSVTTMTSMFAVAEAFNQNINSWNVTNLLTTASMFYYAKSYNQPLNNWDVNSVVNMSRMFQGASVFNQPINPWDVSAVANMTSMFEDAIAFNQPLGNWNVSSVTLMKSMFEDAAVFNQNINTWDVGVVTQMEEMFKGAIAFNEPLGNWDTGEVLTMKEMFSGATIFNQNINTWNTSFVTTMEEMFKDARAYNQTMNALNVASVTTMRGMFQGATAFNGTIDNWNVRRVGTMENMFSGATNFNQTVNSWRVANVQNMNGMFRNATSFNQSLNRWDLGTVTMRSFLDGATSYNQYLGDWNVSRVTDMRDMLDRTALTRTNYDNTLIAWSQQTLTNGVALGAQGLLYCDALEERQSMISNFSWTISDDVLDCPKPECTQLVSPLNGATNVPVNTNLNWAPALFARGYRLTVGTTAGGTNIVNNQTVSTTSYQFPTNFSGGETLYVTIIPFNDEGNAVGPCTQERFTISNNTATVPNCTTLVAPLNGATNVNIATDLSWQPIANADGYRLTVGTTSGGNNILNAVNVGNLTTYNLPTNLPEDTDIFVTITPYNDLGSAPACTEARFKTELIPVPPACTTLTNPLNGATNVTIDTDLSWNVVPNATGYLVIVGTTQGGIEIVNNVDALNATTFNIPDDLLPNRTYYVTIIPYNEVGDAVGCSEQSFRMGAAIINTPPACTSLTSPLNGATNVPIGTNISWNIASNATGYNLTIGTSTGNSDILATTNVGNFTTYNPPVNLPEATTIYVSIVPFNAVGNATGCTQQSFTTETVARVPNCTTLINALANASEVAVDTAIAWEQIANADGYRLTLGTTPNGSDILNNEDVGSLSSYNLTTNLPFETTIYVSITPYNAQGEAFNCAEQSFTTAVAPLLESEYGISPNGDGINDFWEIKGIENSPQNTVNIYNRWGDLVFSISNYNNRTNVFNGTANKLINLGAGQLPSGTYFFDIKVEGSHNLKKLKGFLVIKR
ncbi:MAG: BspA family leucine-rich repeat surface protein [Confluentibacter sp.]|nr:BspA family leucine-rich repeat surface protein [Confluentibacter sp.]